MNRFIAVSGCSGGGKSTLLAELARRGHAVVEEPGRRIVAEEMAAGGQALPWLDPAGFARRAVAMAIADLEAAQALEGWVFFDRGLVDAATALAFATGEPQLDRRRLGEAYARIVFFAPPWRDIFAADPERRHGFEAAAAEHGRLDRAYRALGYALAELPKTSVEARADLVLAMLRDREPD